MSHAGDRLGKKAAEKSDDFIMKQLQGLKKPVPTPRGKKPTKPKQEQEDYNVILNRLISGNGLIRK